MGKDKYNFQKLTPTKGTDLKIYDEALDFVFEEEDLKNIAITGAYSAGKSSVLETYKDQRPNKRFLNISLTHFESNQDRDIKYDYKTLEGKILNKLIHQIERDKIPLTHFKVKKDVPKKHIAINTVLISLFIGLLIYIMGFNVWGKFIQGSESWMKNALAFTTRDSTVVIAGVIGIGILIYALYKLVKMILYNKLFFKRFNFNGNEIEILSDDNGSYFDKYLNEILYLFENAKVDAIVFEDMDRFNYNRIFEKLREINDLINKRSSTIIRFFYLLRDDAFTSKDRTKFFDYIIPIVPIVDGSNSYDLLLDLFKRGGILKDFYNSFLQDLSLYIDDMRILKNIYNEYIVYHGRIQSTDLDANKLLAIISYKNIFPRDFSELQLGMGFVYTLLDNKDNFVSEELNRIDNEIKENWVRVAELDSELLEDINELDALYFIWDGYLEVNGRKEKRYSSRSEMIKEMKQYPESIEQIIGRNDYSFDFNSKYDELTQDKTYSKRKKIIEDKGAKVKKELKEQIDTLEKRKEKISSQKVNEIITRKNINKIFDVNFINEIGEQHDFKDVKTSPYFPLIKYLIRNGYIDETYPDYMTYFYENSLSRTDKIFLRSVSDKIPKEFTYKINDPATVVARMKIVDFEEVESLNFDLLTYLLKFGDKNLQRFITQLRVNKRFDFILKFWETKRELKEFVKSLNYLWPSIFNEMLSDTLFADVSKRMYIIDSFYYSSQNDILNLNENNCLTDYIADNEDFLQVNEPDVAAIMNNLISLDVSFKQINHEISNSYLFNNVYQSNLYQLNISNISLVLNKVYDIPRSEDYKHKNYTLVISQPNQQLARYAKNNMNSYIDVVLRHCDDSQITDSEDAALEIINEANIDSDHKSTYIKYLKTTITNLDNIENSIYWSLFLQYNNVMNTVSNIITYYTKNKMNSYLIDFINKNSTTLDFNQVVATYDRDLVSSFFEDTLLSNDLDDDKYEMILKGLDKGYSEYAVEGISDRKFHILIKLNVIYMNSANLYFVRENYPNHLMFFIEYNIDRYIELMDEENFSFHELEQLLYSDLEDKYKLSLLKYTSDPISIKNETYSYDIRCYILKNNFDIEDISYLVRIYEQENPTIKELVCSICIEHIDELISKEINISYKLLIKLFKSTKIDDDIKTELFILQLDKLNKKQALDSMIILDMQVFASLFEGKMPRISRAKNNKRILSIFQSKGWISSFEIDKKDQDFYRARGRKQ